MRIFFQFLLLSVCEIWKSAKLNSMITIQIQIQLSHFTDLQIQSLLSLFNHVTINNKSELSFTIFTFFLKFSQLFYKFYTPNLYKPFNEISTLFWPLSIHITNTYFPHLNKNLFHIFQSVIVTLTLFKAHSSLTRIFKK